MMTKEELKEELLKHFHNIIRQVKWLDNDVKKLTNNQFYVVYDFYFDSKDTIRVWLFCKTHFGRELILHNFIKDASADYSYEFDSFSNNTHRILKLFNDRKHYKYNYDNTK